MNVSMAVLKPITGETADRFLRIAEQAKVTKQTMKKVMELASMVENRDNKGE